MKRVREFSIGKLLVWAGLGIAAVFVGGFLWEAGGGGLILWLIPAVFGGYWIWRGLAFAGKWLYGKCRWYWRGWKYRKDLKAFRKELNR